MDGNENYPLYEVERITNLRQLVDMRAEHSVKESAFVFERNGGQVQISYRRFRQETEKLGTFLCSLGFANAKIAVLGENSYEWILAFFSIVGANNVVVPLDKEASVNELEEIMADSGCTALVYSDTYRDFAEELKDRMKLSCFNMDDFSKYMETGAKEIADGNRGYLGHKVDEDGVTAIVYTSGTTGRRKGVMLTHRGFAMDTYGACQIGKFNGDTMLLLPLHHTFGMVAGVFVTMLYGYTVYINSSLRNLMPDFQKAKPKMLFLVPLFVETLYKNIWNGIAAQGKTDIVKQMIRDNREQDRDIPQIRGMFGLILDLLGGNLEYIISGGAPLHPKYIQGFADFGITVLNGYGITECSPVVCVNRNYFHKDRSVGMILDFIEVKIENPDEHGEGEICVRGDIVMKGYYHMEEATREVLLDGWFHTGDLGYMDEDRFLYVTGRKKNLIILSNGENISPEGLEEAVSDIPLVKEVMVYGEAAENKIVAEIFPDEDEIAGQNIPDVEKALHDEIARLNRTLPPYKQIAKIVTRDTEFEKTATKKIKRG